MGKNTNRKRSSPISNSHQFAERTRQIDYEAVLARFGQPLFGEQSDNIHYGVSPS